MLSTPLSVISTRGLFFAFIAAAMLVPSARAGEPASEDPQAAAARYTQQAADLRADAEKHEKAAKMHQTGFGNPKTPHASIAQHCKRLAENLRAAAKESDAIAEAYRKLAEK